METMKTREEILKDSYMMLEYVFSNQTPKETAKKIIELISSRKRVVLDYGDIETSLFYSFYAADLKTV
jgi:uncharacterized protein YutE (UPF0331/DUF86 family)